MKRIQLLLCVALGLAITIGSCSKEYGYVFDNGYNSGEYEDTVSVNVDTNRFKIDYSKYTQARLFPGLIGEDEPRLEDFLVQIDLNYEEIRGSDLRISIAPGAWQSTGVYAPAGELIVIDVPVGVYGLTAQISPHTNTSLNGIDFPQRDPVIFNRQTLFPGKNYMRNLYGGLVYILPARPLGRIVDLYFSGVAKAPSFKLSGLGATTNAEWHEMVENTTVPWFELEGDRIVFTMQTAKLKNYPIPDPTELMETWDESIRTGYWEWTGMKENDSDIRHRAPFNKWRIVHDPLLGPGIAQVSGYPVRALPTDNYFRQASDVNSVKYANWGTYHELGHNMQMNSTWNFAENGEVTCNLFSFKVSRMHGQISYKIPEVWDRAVPYIAARKSRDGSDGTNWSTMEGSFGSHLDVRLMMYAQIFEYTFPNGKDGYDFMPYLYRRAREARFTSANDQSRVDFFYEALSEFAEMDMERYLNRGWGIYPSNVSKNYVSNTLGLPPLETALWEFNPVTGEGGDGPMPRDIVHLEKEGWDAMANSWDSRPNNSYRPATNLIDGVLTSLWHPCVSGCDASGPNYQNNQVPNGTYEIVINTGTAVTAKGFTLLQRPAGDNNHRNHVRRITVEVSSDGNTYNTLGTYDLLYAPSAAAHPAYETQEIDFHSDEGEETFSHIRFKILRSDVNGDGSSNAVLAELGLFTF